MQPHSSFDALARVIEQLGSDPRSVRRVEAVAGAGDEPLRAEVDVSMPIRGAASSDEAGLEPIAASTDGDELSVTFEIPTLAEASPSRAGDAEDRPPVSARPIDARVDGGDAVLTLDVTLGPTAGKPTAAVPTAEESTTSDSTTAVDGPATNFSLGGGEPKEDERSSGEPKGDEPREEVVADGEAAYGTETDAAPEPSDAESALAAARDESVPPYEDEAYLRRLYDACETFGEMSERIEMDVSAETVRRYMIDAGVHSPASYATDEADPSGSNGRSSRSADGRGRSPADDVGRDPLSDDQLLADGIGLPDDLALRDVVDAVVEARTVYEVHQRLGVDQERTRRLLRQLNVLDLVLRRVSDEPERPPSYETVTARIRQAGPDGV